MQYWFYVNGETVGPLDEARTRTLVAKGAIRIDSFCWTDGWSEWRRVADARELTERFADQLKDRKPASTQQRPAEPRRSRQRAAARARTAGTRDSAPKTDEQGNLASFGERFLAGAIDAVLIAVAFLGLAWLVGELDLVAVMAGEAAERIPAWLETLGYLGSAAYFLGLMSRLGGGQTIGYSAMGLQLVGQRDEQPPDIVPLLLWYVTSWLAFIGWVWYFNTEKRQMLHNLVSRTIVIRKPE